MPCSFSSARTAAYPGEHLGAEHAWSQAGLCVRLRLKHQKRTKSKEKSYVTSIEEHWLLTAFFFFNQQSSKMLQIFTEEPNVSRNKKNHFLFLCTL